MTHSQFEDSTQTYFCMNDIDDKQFNKYNSMFIYLFLQIINII